MAKIVSREDTDAGRLKQLQDIILKYGRGAIGQPGDNAQFDVAQNIDHAVEQIDDLLTGAMMAISTLRLAVEVQSVKLAAALIELEVANDLVDKLIDDISYDDAMDHAALDLMDGFASSGAAEVSADGELVFDERVTFKKEDLKPYLREAIVRWVEVKLSK